MRVGFIGLGNLGRHLAGSLLKAGFELTVSDLDKAAAAELLEQGASWADKPADIASGAETVFTCLPSPAAIDAVAAGPGGLLENMTPGSVWVDMSTNDPHETQRLAALGETRGIRVLEAPVTGGVHRAASGEIAVLVGGEEAIYRRLRPAFEAMGGEVIYMGPLGAAAVIKVITNMLAFINLVGLGEALMLAKRGGLDLGKAYQAIRASSGNSFVHETESQVILNGSYDIGFTMDLACKDLGFAKQLGEEFGVPLDLARLVDVTFQRAREAYGGQAWSSMVVRLLEDALGSELRAPGFPARL